MKKGFMLGFLCAALLFTAIGAGAYTLVPSSVKLVVDGTEVKDDTLPMLYMEPGYNYVPVATFRSICDKIGAEFQYVGETGTIEIDTKVDAINPTPISSPTEVLDSADSLKTFLSNNYSTLSTDLGTTTFTFSITENTNTILPFDYKIFVDFDINFFNRALNDNRNDMHLRQKTKAQLKEHQENLAKAAIVAMPNKKLTGSYYHLSRVSSTEGGYQNSSNSYCSWANFDVLAKNYDSATPLAFRWWSIIDENF